MGRFPTAVEVLHGVDLKGKVALVTGGNSGIGVETVRALAHAGATVILTSRNVAAGQVVAEDIAATGVKGSIEVKQLDLADLASVHRLSAELIASGSRLDFLILNAGVLSFTRDTTKDGFDLVMGTNHLGHFALVHDLLPTVQRQDHPVRIVVLSSKGHEVFGGFSGGLRLDDLHYREKGRPYYGMVVYGHSKVANILFAKELARRYAGTNLKAFSVHPGEIHTGVTRKAPWWLRFMEWWVVWWAFISPAQGAAPAVYAATAPELETQSGAYLDRCKVAQPSKQAQDPVLAQRLWELSLKEVGAAAE